MGLARLWVGGLGLALLAAPLHAAAAASITVQGFALKGNSLLSPAQVDAVLRPLHGEQDMAGLRNAAERLQQAYRAAGWGAVVVNLPPQTLDGGVVTLQVLEGKLSQVQVSGQRYFTADNLRASLPALQVGSTPSLIDMDAQLLMANDNPAKTARVVLQPGAELGQVEAALVVEDQDPQRWILGADNSGNPSSGRWRASAAYQHANLADRDHILNLRFETAPERPTQVAVLGLSYRVPVYAGRSAFELSATYSDVESASVQTAAGELAFAGQGSSLGLRWQWYLPQLGEHKQQFSLGWDARSYRNNCSIGDLGSEGCGAAAVAKVDARPLTLGYSVQKLGQLYAGLQWVSNLPLGGAHGGDAAFEQARPGAKPDYGLLRGSWMWQRAIGEAWGEPLSWAWRGAAQWADQPLIAGEQMGLGGAGSVRGYEERELAGDRGLSMALELSRPLKLFAAADEQRGAAWRLIAFADAGVVENRAGTQCLAGQTRCSLVGAGLGLQWLPGRQTTLRLDLAHAFKAGGQTERASQRLHMSFSHAL